MRFKVSYSQWSFIMLALVQVSYEGIQHKVIFWFGGLQTEFHFNIKFVTDKLFDSLQL